MPDVYISRAGMETKQLDEKFTQTELSTVKAHMVQLEQETRIKDDRINQLAQESRSKDDRIERLERDMEAMRQDMDKLVKVLSLDPEAEDVEAALRRKK